VTPSGIEPATFRLVAQCINQIVGARIILKRILNQITPFTTPTDCGVFLNEILKEKLQHILEQVYKADPNANLKINCFFKLAFFSP
jgi:hypothetical protein